MNESKDFYRNKCSSPEINVCSEINLVTRIYNDHMLTIEGATYGNKLC